MAVYNWSTLTNGQTIAIFNPNVDILIFDDALISAANVVFNGDNSVPTPYTTLSYGGKAVTINMDPLATTTTNVTFANGSLLLIGDNTTGTAGDDGANTLTGGSGNDHLIGLSGNDSLVGGSGNDLFTMYTGTLDTWGNDTILGGGGTDTINFNTGDTAAFGLVVTYTGFDVTLGALATITGGDGSPGSTITMSGVERVTGTNLADTFTGTTAIPINGLRSDVTLVFEGAGGNDVINGATGDARTTFISYRSSGSGVTVNLGSGTASNDGHGGADTFNNIDGVLGSDFADSITGGSGSIGSASTLNEYYEGFSGNDIINGGSGTDRAQYDNSPAAVFINLANGTAQDGWTGAFTRITTVNTNGEWGLSDGAPSNLYVNGDALTVKDPHESTGLVRVANAANPIVGSWLLGGTVAVNAATVITFLSDGTYFMAEDGDSVADPSGQDGMERGTYTWNSSTGAFTKTTTVDTSGQWGLSHSTVTNVEVVGDTLNISILNEGTFAFSRVASGSNPLVGGWYVTGGESNSAGVITFLSNGTYLMAEDGDPVLDPSGQDGMERGTYTWNPLAGTDTLISIEQVRGSAFNDTMLGSVEDDQFEGANGNDFIDGGAGFDTVRYTQASGAVYVNLATGEGRAMDTIAGAGVGVDIFTHIEDARGSDFADSLVGGGDGLIDSEAGVFNGVEAFEGRAGNDTIDGGDTVVGSGSIDLVRYLNAPSAVIVNLSAGTVSGVASNTANDGYGVNGNPAGIDTLININGIEGSSFNDTLVGGNNDEFFQGRKGADSIVGGGGIDTLINDNAPAAVTINLGTGVYNDGWGTVDIVSGIENVSGTDFDDTLTGDSNANRLEGGLGEDTLAGGLGNDTLIGGDGNNDVANYSAASGAVVVNLTTGAATGTDGSDTLSGIEHVFGGSSGDTITGDEKFNFIRGNGGDDTLDGGGQSLALASGVYFGDLADYQNAGGAVTVSLALQGSAQNTVNAGNDTLFNFESIRGSSFGDALTGDGNNNFLRGGLGDDTLDGGGGVDWADYRSASGAVSVTLATQGIGQNTLTDGTDTLINIEALSGSDFNDTLTGGTGNDWFRGRNGNDSINGGAGFDTVTYSSETAAVNINLTTDTVTTVAGGTTGTDTVISIEAAEGTVDFNDTLTGANSEDNALYGFGGNDLLRVTTGADSLDGGTGGDRIDFTQTGVTYTGATGVTVNLATHVTDLNNNSGGASEVSTLTSIETVTGTSGNDNMTGGDASHAVDGLGNSITETFQPGAGNDTITGGSHGAVTLINKSAFNTVVDYSGNTAGQAVSVVLGTGGVVGSANDGQGGTDTLFSVGQVRGGAGNDSLVGGSLNRTGSGTFFEIFRGNDGNDTLNGGNAASDGDGAGTDRADYSNNTSTQAITVNLQTGIVLDGRGGTDTLIDIFQVYGGAGNDTFQGGIENDVFDGGVGNDTLNGGTGTDEARFSQSTAGAIVNLSAASIKVNGITVFAGTASDGMGGTDTLISIESVRGSSFGDYIRGSDNVNTRQFYLGDDGDDTIDGGAGIDFANYSNVTQMQGGLNALIENGSGTVNDKTGGTDTLINIEGLAGTHSNDTLTGGLGDQWFRGNGGNDTMDGGSGNDWVLYSSDPSGVTINLGAGTATDGWNGLTGLLALGGTDTLISIENAEGSDYNDHITGDSGANVLRGRGGNDTLDGGAGIDTASFGNSTAGVNINLALGTISDGFGGTDTLISIENIEGSRQADMLVGSANAEQLDGSDGDDNIFGGDGDDTLIGGAGNDTLDGGPGVDSMVGGAGDDLYYVDNNSDLVVELTNEGIDTVIASVSITAPGNVENFQYVGVAGGGITGNALGNVLTAVGAGSITLSGLDGDDTIAGSVGNDTLNGELDNDTVSYAYETHSVTIDLALNTATGSGNDTLSGFENAQGGSAADTLIGNSAANILDGGAGADTLQGGAGNDFYVVDNVLDVVQELTNGPTGPVSLVAVGVDGFTDTVKAAVNYTLTAFVENLTLSGTAIIGIGNELDNQITGNELNDTLTGGLGNDTLDGGAGIDMAIYAGNSSDYQINIMNGIATVIDLNGAGGNEGTDSLSSIETLRFSNLDIALTASVVIIPGGFSNDNLVGGTGADSISGGAGNDKLTGGLGNDTLDGGVGVDTALYAGAYRQSVLNGNPSISATFNGPEGNDTLISIENLKFLDGSRSYDAGAHLWQAYRLYGAAFDRIADSPGLNYHTARLDTGVSLAVVAQDFTGSAEFQVTYGSLDNSGFVNQLYLNVLNRLADPGGLTYWLGQLSGGATRGDVLMGFSESPENIGNYAGQLSGGLWDINETAASAARLYWAALDRAPDVGGLTYWTGQLTSGVQTLSQAAGGFVGSPEFQSAYGSLNNTQFVTLLYANVLDRLPDGGGLAYWQGLLDTGTSRADVTLGFSESFEFQVNILGQIDNGITVI